MVAALIAGIFDLWPASNVALEKGKRRTRLLKKPSAEPALKVHGNASVGPSQGPLSVQHQNRNSCCDWFFVNQRWYCRDCFPIGHVLKHRLLVPVLVIVRLLGSSSKTLRAIGLRPCGWEMVCVQSFIAANVPGGATLGLLSWLRHVSLQRPLAKREPSGTPSRGLQMGCILTSM